MCLKKSPSPQQIWTAGHYLSLEGSLETASGYMVCSFPKTAVTKDKQLA